MSTFLSFIGGAFLVACILGAILPGLNFHVVLAGDKEAQKWHARLAAELSTRIEEKEKTHE